MGPFTTDPGLMFWTLVTFGGLVWILARFAFKPLKTLTDRREQIIRESLERAEKAQLETTRLLAGNEELLVEARTEARTIINDAHKIVARMQREATDSSKRDADAIISQARTEIDREVQRSLGELKTTVANLSLRISRQIIKSEMDEARHAQLADDFIERLKKSHARR